jgi:hypothetical protein
LDAAYTPTADFSLWKFLGCANEGGIGFYESRKGVFVQVYIGRLDVSEVNAKKNLLDLEDSRTILVRERTGMHLGEPQTC